MDTPTHPPKRRWPLLAGAALVVAAGAVVLAAVLSPRGGDEPGPVAVVAAFEVALDRGDHAAAHALVDYRFRLAEVLGSFFEGAPETDRAELERLTQGMLIDTTEKMRPLCCRGRAMRRVVSEAGQDDTWVSSSPDDGGAFTWRYRLIRKEGAWRITQREYLKGRTPSNTTRFWDLARKAVARELGRDPTLSEFNTNLPSVMPTLRVRTLTVPELPKAPAPAPAAP